MRKSYRSSARNHKIINNDDQKKISNRNLGNKKGNSKPKDVPKTRMMKDREKKCTKSIDIKRISPTNNLRISKFTKKTNQKIEKTEPKFSAVNGATSFKTNINISNNTKVNNATIMDVKKKLYTINNISDTSVNTKDNILHSENNKSNLSLIRSDNSVVNNIAVNCDEKSTAISLNKPISIEPESENNADKKIVKQTKRKLNLKEYMMRKKCGGEKDNLEKTTNKTNSHSDETSSLNENTAKKANLNISNKIVTDANIIVGAPKVLVASHPIVDRNASSESLQSNNLNTTLKPLTSIVNTEPRNTDSPSVPKPKIFDPIGDASRKALMLKKCSRKEEDIERMIPVIPPSAIVPLEEMIKPKDEIKQITELPRKCNPDYEEIVLVSIGINTVISRLPSPVLLPDNKLSFVVSKKNVLPDNIFDGARDKSKLKVLVDINDRILKGASKKEAKITSNSLFSSIQDAILRTTSPPRDKNLNKTDKINNSPILEVKETIEEGTTAYQMDEIEHGEDKVIMHLRKDRLRSKTANIACQADLDSSFKPLEVLKSTAPDKQMDRSRGSSESR